MAIPAGLMKVDDTPANERCYAVDACLALALHTLRITSNFRMVSVLTQVDEQGNVHKKRIEDDVSHADVVLRISNMATRSVCSRDCGAGKTIYGGKNDDVS